MNKKSESLAVLPAAQPQGLSANHTIQSTRDVNTLSASAMTLYNANLPNANQLYGGSGRTLQFSRHARFQFQTQKQQQEPSKTSALNSLAYDQPRIVSNAQIKNQSVFLSGKKTAQGVQQDRLNPLRSSFQQESQRSFH